MKQRHVIGKEILSYLFLILLAIAAAASSASAVASRTLYVIIQLGRYRERYCSNGIVAIVVAAIIITLILKRHPMR